MVYEENHFAPLDIASMTAPSEFKLEVIKIHFGVGISEILLAKSKPLVSGIMTSIINKW